MPADSPFSCAWWYRTEFSVPAKASLPTAWLHFDGINYRANVWLNGEKIGDAEDVAGMMRVFEFEVSKRLVTGKPNALAAEVFAPDRTDLAMTWVDWNPTPPDKDMGYGKTSIWRRLAPLVCAIPLWNPNSNRATRRHLLRSLRTFTILLPIRSLESCMLKLRGLR